MSETNINVLLIEDNPGDSRLIQEYLLESKEEQFKIAWFSKLQEGLDYLLKNQIDVMILDLNLPDCHGIETLHKVHAQDKSTPILILTGRDDLIMARRAVKDGAQDYLLKSQLEPMRLIQSMIFAIERKKTEEVIKYKAFHDFLTGLPNRRLFYDRLQLEISRSLRDKDQVVVLILDLDNFKHVNDTFGHDIGDLLLKSVSNRLHKLFRSSDTVARVGGDEFMIILTGIKNSRDAYVVAEKCIKSIGKEYIINESVIQISTSIGIAIFPEDGSEMNELIKNADKSLYLAKEEGRNNYKRIKLEQKIMIDQDVSLNSVMQ